MFVADGLVWTMETKYIGEDGGRVHYQATAYVCVTRADGVEGLSVVVVSEWKEAPSPAYVQAITEYKGCANGTRWPSDNGKLYVGVTYDYPQAFLRAHFTKNPGAEWSDDIKACVRKWLDPAAQSQEAVDNYSRGPDALVAGTIVFGEQEEEGSCIGTATGEEVAGEEVAAPAAAAPQYQVVFVPVYSFIPGPPPPSSYSPTLHAVAQKLAEMYPSQI
jgi:hypothetical protein